MAKTRMKEVQKSEDFRENVAKGTANISRTKFPFIGGKKPWAVYHVSVTANKTDIIIVSF